MYIFSLESIDYEKVPFWILF